MLVFGTELGDISEAYGLMVSNDFHNFHEYLQVLKE